MRGAIASLKLFIVTPNKVQNVAIDLFMESATAICLYELLKVDFMAII